jgi:hypothetical protein
MRFAARVDLPVAEGKSDVGPVAVDLVAEEEQRRVEVLEKARGGLFRGNWTGPRPIMDRIRILNAYGVSETSFFSRVDTRQIKGFQFKGKWTRRRVAYYCRLD